MPFRALSLILAGLALAALALAAWRLVRRRRRQTGRLRKAARRLKYPVVLAHGFFGFDQLQIGANSHAYFREVGARLKGVGAEVHTPRVSPSASIAVRAGQLAEAVRQIDAKRVNIIAHSMGGLDARYAVAQLGLSAKVCSITTVGTPHRGTPLADLSARLGLPGAALRKMIEALGLSLEALDDLTPARMDDFNRRVADMRGVTYASYIARTPGRLTQTHPLLMPTHRLVSSKAGENDGMVPVSSQAWGEVLGRIEADHWAQIGWSRRFDAPGFYASVLDELRARGF